MIAILEKLIGLMLDHTTLPQEQLKKAALQKEYREYKTAEPIFAEGLTPLEFVLILNQKYSDFLAWMFSDARLIQCKIQDLNEPQKKALKKFCKNVELI